MAVWYHGDMTGTMDGARLAMRASLPKIGQGYFRNVYILDNVVYKVMYCYEDGDVNIDENTNLERLKGMSLPAGIAIPDSTLYRLDEGTVMAMEYIDGIEMGECWHIEGREYHDIHCLDEHTMDLINYLGIIDLSMGNVIYSDGLYYIVDLGA